MSLVISRNKNWATNNERQIQQWLEEHQPVVNAAVYTRFRHFHIILALVIVAEVGARRPR